MARVGPKSAISELILASLGGDGVRSLLAIDAARFVAHLPADAVRELAAPEDETLGGLCDEVHDMALVGGLGAASALTLARALSARVRPRGTIAFALPTARPGLTSSSLLRLFRRKRPVLLEELCEALLVAGLEEIEARELEGASGTSLVWGRVREEPVSP